MHTLKAIGSVFFWVLLFISRSVLAQTNDCTSKSVYFGNGVWTISEIEAGKSLVALRQKLQASATPEVYATAKFRLSYNKSVSKLSDLFETFRQIVGNEYPTIMMKILLHRLPLYVLTDEQLVRLNNLFVDAAARRMIGGELVASEVAMHTAHYKMDIANGNNVLVVAHSQGNLFLNLAFLGLSADEQQHLAMVPVASPDSIARHSISTPDHVTFSNDVVISLVQFLRNQAGLPDPLSFNDVADPKATYWVHEFVPEYLRDESSLKIIQDAATYSFSALPAPQTVNMACGANFDPYLPRVLAGRTSSVSSCGPSKTFGSITITPTGEYTGSGCYAPLTFGPYRSLYQLIIGPGASPTGQFSGVHKFFGSPGFSVTQDANRLFVKGGVRAATAANPDATITSNVLEIDPAARMTGWLDYISNRPCGAAYPGQVRQPAHIERSATHISIKTDSATLLSAPLIDALQAPPTLLHFQELFRNDNSLLVTYWHSSDRPNNNALTLTMSDPAADVLHFDFSLSKQDQSGQTRAMSCKK